jgi:hypothetical protein
MKRMTPWLLCLALATWGTGCTTSNGTGPDPVPDPVSSGPPVRWAGTATFVEDVQSTTSDWTNRFEIEVTWVKVDNPSPAPPAGTTRYVPSGRVHVIMRSYQDIGRCSIDRDGYFPVSPTAAAQSPQDQRLDLGPDGRYEGRLYGSWRLDYLQLCNVGAFQQSTVLYASLDISGALDAGRMHGDMPPRVLSNDTLTSTRTGSWNFTSN